MSLSRDSRAQSNNTEKVNRWKSQCRGPKGKHLLPDYACVLWPATNRNWEARERESIERDKEKWLLSSWDTNLLVFKKTLNWRFFWGSGNGNGNAEMWKTKFSRIRIRMFVHLLSPLTNFSPFRNNGFGATFGLGPSDLRSDVVLFSSGGISASVVGDGSENDGGEEQDGGDNGGFRCGGGGGGGGAFRWGAINYWSMGVLEMGKFIKLVNIFKTANFPEIKNQFRTSSRSSAHAWSLPNVKLSVLLIPHLRHIPFSHKGHFSRRRKGCKMQNFHLFFLIFSIDPFRKNEKRHRTQNFSVCYCCSRQFSPNTDSSDYTFAGN